MTRPRRSAALGARSATTKVRCSQRSLPSNRAANRERPCTATLLSITSRSPGSSTTARSASFERVAHGVDHALRLRVDADREVGVEHERRRVGRAGHQGHGRAELVGSVAEEARIDGRAVSRFEHRLDGRRRQHVEQVVHAGHRRLGCRVATETEQQQVARAVRVERRLGVEHERRPRRRGGLAVGVAARRHDVLHDASAVLGDVADRLAQAARDREQGQFGRQVLAGRFARRGGSRRKGADRDVADEERARAVRLGSEPGQGIVDVDRKAPAAHRGLVHERLVEFAKVRADRSRVPRRSIDRVDRKAIDQCGHLAALPLGVSNWNVCSRLATNWNDVNRQPRPSTPMTTTVSGR